MTWTVTPEPHDSPAATALWRAYYTEVSDRYYLLHENRRTAPEELEQEITRADWSDLTPPKGRLLVARLEGEPAGTAGVHLTTPTTAELKRVFVQPRMRGRGGAQLLVEAAENEARALGATRMILDTRHDLTEARALYTRLGYEETPPHNNDKYADHWFSKTL